MVTRTTRDTDKFSHFVSLSKNTLSFFSLFSAQFHIISKSHTFEDKVDGLRYMDLDQLLNNGPKFHIFKVAYEVKNVFVTCYLFELMLLSLFQGSMLHSSKRYLLRSREKWFECGIGVYVARDEAAEISKTEYSSTICYFPFCSSILSLKLLAKSQSSTILFSHYTRYRKGW